ncbi:insulin-like growth factor-binding protein complex acid labile subunit [Onthophagus taurus]|uniref:insulin-like growth factor-binding protein complex acid labile subunit n=1 Tax=Onthophagus taurus TaxID=166361 RepID=UPI000C208B99|nr:leucine-rich repeat-containing protein 15-like [Onthophagus taurus]
MLLRWHVISPCLILLWLYPAYTMCPIDCLCRVDEAGKRRIACTKGGMIDPIPTFNMDPDMEILEISAPDREWNILTVNSIFQGFKMLEEVHITRSNIVQIGQHAFWGVPSIRVLNLTHNNLTTLFDHNFRGLVNLVELNLDDNAISRVPSGAFRHLSELRILSLRRNYVRELSPRLFIKLSKLQVLKISENPLVDLDPEVFKDVPELRVLECRACGISRINTQIYHLLPYLTHLDLGDNRIQFLDTDEFIDLRRLKSLYLDGNMLPVVLEKAFVHQIRLRTLCLARNRLAKVTSTAFFNLSTLIDLDISYNKLSKFDVESLNPVANSLQRFSISGNQFSASMVKSILQVMYKVRDLSIADLKLEEFPHNFISGIQVQKLNISGNLIKNLTVQSLPTHLSLLDASRNRIVKISEKLLKSLIKIETVYLNNNSFSCRLCDVLPVLNFLNKTRTNITNIKGLNCVTPLTLKNNPIDLTLKQRVLPKCPTPYSELSFVEKMKQNVGLVIGIVSLIVFLTACVLFVVLSCLRRHRNHGENKERRRRKRTPGIEMSEDPSVAFGSKPEISFKFPLDLTERRASISTIDDMKKESELSGLPNGTVL